MPTIQNPMGYATPLGQSIASVADMFTKLPSRYENDAARAKADAYRASIAKTGAETDALRRKALAPGDIANLFGAVRNAPEAPRPNPDFVGAMPRVPADQHAAGLTPQLMQSGLDAGLNPTQLGSLIYQFYGQAGASDEARARALPGPMGINDVFSIRDRDESLRFREELDRGTELAKIAATPLTEAQLKADILKRQPEAFQALTVAPTRAQFEGGSLAQLFAGGDDLTRFNDRQAAALDIEPKNPPNVSVLQYDLNGQSGTVRADDQETINRIIAEDGRVFPATAQGSTSDLGLAKPVLAAVQKDNLATARFRRLLGQTRTTAAKSASNFGFPGFVKGTLQDTSALARGVAQGLGYETLGAAVSEAAKEAQDRQVSDMSLEVWTTAFDPTLSELETLTNLLAYSAASALAGQDGRSVSDTDFLTMRDKVLGDPNSFFMNQERFLSKLDVLDLIVGGRQEATDAFVKGGGASVSDAFAASPAGGRPAAGAVPVPAEYAQEPDGAILEDSAGRRYEKRGGQLIPVQ